MRIQAPPSKLTHKLRVLEYVMQTENHPIEKSLLKSMIEQIEHDMQHVDKHRRIVKAKKIKSTDKDTNLMLF
jgi:hypothetical protein